jgi:hypothetical protein
MGLLIFKTHYCAAARLSIGKSKREREREYVQREERENGALIAWL